MTESIKDQILREFNASREAERLRKLGTRLDGFTDSLNQILNSASMSHLTKIDSSIDSSPLPHTSSTQFSQRSNHRVMSQDLPPYKPFGSQRHVGDPGKSLTPKNRTTRPLCSPEPTPFMTEYKTRSLKRAYEVNAEIDFYSLPQIYSRPQLMKTAPPMNVTKKRKGASPNSPMPSTHQSVGPKVITPRASTSPRKRFRIN